MDPALADPAPVTPGLQNFYHGILPETALSGIAQAGTAADVETVSIYPAEISGGYGIVVCLGFQDQSTGRLEREAGEQTGKQYCAAGKTQHSAQNRILFHNA